MQLHHGSRKLAELQWAFVLAHEFTHAFVYRYKTSRLPPLWVNEGLADTVAMEQFPIVREYERASLMMRRTQSLAEFFQTEATQREFAYYPVNRTLVETLIAKDRRAFIQWFDDMKAGEDAEAALKKRYGWTFADLEGYWRRYVTAMVNRR